MRRLTLLLLVLFVLPGCSYLGLGSSEPKIQLQVVDSGLYKYGALSMATAAAPQKLGTTFGFRFKVVDAGPSGEMPVKTVTRTPGYIDPKTNQVVLTTERTDSVKIGETYDCFFTFEFPYEMASGDWTLEVHTKEGQVLKQVFSVYSEKM